MGVFFLMPSNTMEIFQLKYMHQSQCLHHLAGFHIEVVTTWLTLELVGTVPSCENNSMVIFQEVHIQSPIPAVAIPTTQTLNIQVSMFVNYQQEEL